MPLVVIGYITQVPSLDIAALGRSVISETEPESVLQVYGIDTNYNLCKLMGRGIVECVKNIFPLQAIGIKKVQ